RGKPPDPSGPSVAEQVGAVELSRPHAARHERAGGDVRAQLATVSGDRVDHVGGWTGARRGITLRARAFAVRPSEVPGAALVDFLVGALTDVVDEEARTARGVAVERHSVRVAHAPGEDLGARRGR